MKKPERVYNIFLLILLNITLNAQLSFTVNNANGNYSITCTNTLINLSATSNYTNSTVTYSWTTPQLNTFMGATLNASTPGIYSVSAVAGTLSSSQTLAIGINTTQPGANITATSTVITCSSPSIFATGTSSTSGVSFNWVLPLGNVTSQTCVIYFAGTPTFVVLNPNNGCQSSATISVKDGRVYPNISASQSNYTLTCQGGTVNLSPVISGTTNLTFIWSFPVSASVSGSNTSVLNTNAPGNYIVLATDPSNGCQTQVSYTVTACVGIDERIKDNLLVQFYPSPAESFLICRINNKDIQKLSYCIFNLEGKVLMSEERKESVFYIDVSSLNTGVYFISFNTPVGNFSKKFIKQ